MAQTDGNQSNITTDVGGDLGAGDDLMVIRGNMLTNTRRVYVLVKVMVAFTAWTA